jgi:hypothetical protein
MYGPGNRSPWGFDTLGVAVLANNGERGRPDRREGSGDLWRLPDGRAGSGALARVIEPR